MGLLDGLRSVLVSPAPKEATHKRKYAPAVKKTPADVRIELENAQLRATNQALKRMQASERGAEVDEALLQRAGVLPKHGAVVERRDDLDTALSVIEKMKKVGMLGDLKEVDSSGGMPEWAQALLAGLGANPVVLPLLMQRLGLAGPAPSVTVETPTATVQAPTNYPRLAAPDPQPAHAQTVEEDATMDPSSMAIKSLDGKSPAEAARILWSNPFQTQESKAILILLCETPDEDFVPTADRLAREHPAFAGLVQWLFKRPAWTTETIKELRLISGVAPIEAATAAMAADYWGI